MGKGESPHRPFALLAILEEVGLGLRLSTDLIKELLPSGVWLDGKLQLRLHGGHLHSHLQLNGSTDALW